MNTKKFIIIRSIIIFFLNTPLWVYLIGSMIPYATFGEFKLTWIDYLRLSDKVEWYSIFILYVFIAISLVSSVFYVRFLLKEHKRLKERAEDRAIQQHNQQELIEAIKQQKELEKQEKESKKDERNIRKYLD